MRRLAKMLFISGLTAASSNVLAESNFLHACEEFNKDTKIVVDEKVYSFNYIHIDPYLTEFSETVDIGRDNYTSSVEDDIAFELSMISYATQSSVNACVIGSGNATLDELVGVQLRQ